jgi:cobalamin biosynthesis Mg chelatase CobN
MKADEQLKRVAEKLQELLKKYEVLQKENEKLKRELIPAKQREVGFMEQIGNLEQKVMVLKTSTGKMDETDKKDLDKKLHVYLKEIDRCISMLSE